MNTTITQDPAWERQVLTEIEQTRWFLGLSRTTCPLSDDTVARVWTVSLLVTALAFAATNGPAHYAVLVAPYVVMRITGALYSR